MVFFRLYPLGFQIALLRTIFTKMINLHQTIFYLKYLGKAKTRHGVHSPFVYRLVDTVIYDFQAKIVYQDIEHLRNKVFNDKNKINIAKSDTESNVNNKQKAAGNSAKSILNSAKLDQLIYRLAVDLKPRNIIELGSGFGISTAYLSKAAPEARIISIEENPETGAITSENLKELSINHVEFLVGNFDQLLTETINKLDEFDFVFINGNHTKDALLNYFKHCLPRLSENSVMIFREIYRSREMREAWKEIKSNPKVSVSIDLFWFGLVFVRKAQVKEDFMIRF